MRNREATNQICVNCELNPPVDPEETPAQETTPEAPTETTISAPITPPTQLTMTAPAPTSALPSVPGHGAFRPPSPVSHRTSVMDPMLEARRNLRPTGRLGGSPLPPSTPPPPRTSTPLPMPPMTPPPTSAAPAKPVSAPLAKASIPLPLGPPPATLSPPPPPGTLMPQPVPRDMKRSPQSSIVISGNILPPSTPPPPPPNASDSFMFPTPPSEPPVVSAPIEIVELKIEEDPSAQEPTEEIVEPKEAVIAVETVTTETMEQEEEEEEEEEVAILEPMDTAESDSDGESLAPSQASQAFVTAAIEVVSTEAQEQDEVKEEEPRDEDDEEKGAESDDDFEDAEEEVYKPTEEEIKAREAKREQSERASRLIGQKMLQGWAMLQDPCPNADCHGVPLLRSREKKEYCVVCENFFQREEDLEHGKYTIVPTPLPAAPKTEEVEPPTPAAAPAPPALPLAPAPTTPAPPVPLTPPSSEEIQQAGTAFQFPAPPSSQPPSTPTPPPQNPTSMVSPNVRASVIGSPYTSPSMGRSQRELHGRVSNSIILPPSLGMASQQILGKHLSEDFDKLASDDEETRKHMNIIRKVGEFSSNSRPASTYSNSSGYHPNEDNRIYSHPSQRHAAQHQHQHQHQAHPHQYYHQNGTDANSPPPPPPLAPEVLALVSATHKTIATILVKLEAYRQALEVSENPKECQLLTVQIKGLMECLKACRETL
ncbi:hypothetical protein BG000_004566 [Podila horticola]|nr:hypothetical protein BG000_004566 [Podila horticola]